MERIKTQSISKNFLLQFLYQSITLIIPLIITPYLTRTLGSFLLGEYVYIESIAYYFIIFANLGISKHGQRIISTAKNDEELRKRFWSLFVVHFLLSALSLFLYLLFIVLFVEADSLLYYIVAIYVASAIFDVTWLFYGLENFSSVVFKNIFIRLFEIVFIFVFVKTSRDIAMYAFIVSFANFAGQLCLIPSVIKNIKPIRFCKDDISAHLKPLFVFSLTVIAITLYTVFDKTLLGILSTKENVALYEYSSKIINIPKTFVAIIGIVLYPRACRLVSKKDIEGQKKFFDISLSLVCFLGFASIFGLFALGDEIAFHYLGPDFVEAGSILKVMSFLPLIVGVGDIARTQYLIPNKMDRQYSICIFANSLLNLVLSIALIPYFGVYGAIIGTSVAELCGSLVQFSMCKPVLNIKTTLISFPPFFIIGFIMYLVVVFLKTCFDDSIASLIIEFVIGALVYIVLSWIYLRFFRKETIKSLMEENNAFK